MNRRALCAFAALVFLFLHALAAAAAAAEPPAPPWFTWSTVVNNNDPIPQVPERTFNSYNQPSVNAAGMVVFRARSRGGGGLGPATHGIYLRDMSDPAGGAVHVLNRSTEVPCPNNLHSTFTGTPSFPRIDRDTDTIVTRGNHQPVWRYSLSDGSETRAGTSGIYIGIDGNLRTGAAKLGAVPSKSVFRVPGFDAPLSFDVFPGAPSVTDRSTIVFKGNYTVDGTMKTGVYFRDLADMPAGGGAPLHLIADSYTLIPGSDVYFGSTAPPSAVGRRAVFTGLDDEENPSLGGIYLVDLVSEWDPDAGRPLNPLVSIGARVPGESPKSRFIQLSEGLTFDGRYVGFWGAWGEETKTVQLFCPKEGNKSRIDYCLNQDPATICDEAGCYQEKQVPVNQGIFIHDIETGRTSVVAKTRSKFDDFLFWNYSGRVAASSGGHGGEDGGCGGHDDGDDGGCGGHVDVEVVAAGGHEGDEGEHDGEPVRWRSSAYVSVSGQGKTSHAVFKAKSGIVTGLYFRLGSGQAALTLVDTTTEGRVLDPEAPEGAIVTEVGLEREGLRNGWLVINARMGIEGGSHDDGMAGIYLTRVPQLQ